MTKLEFVDSINDLEEKKHSIEKEFIESNKKFNILDKVRITGTHGTRIGIIRGFVISYFSQTVNPIIAQVKKDGSAHPYNNIRVGYDDIIEKI